MRELVELLFGQEVVVQDRPGEGGVGGSGCDGEQGGESGGEVGQFAAVLKGVVGGFGGGGGGGCSRDMVDEGFATEVCGRCGWCWRRFGGHDLKGGIGALVGLWPMGPGGCFVGSR